MSRLEYFFKIFIGNEINRSFWSPLVNTIRAKKTSIMKTPDKNTPDNPSSDASHTVGAGTNIEEQKVEDNEGSEQKSNDPSTWPGGDQSLEELLDKEDKIRSGNANPSGHDDSTVENP
jgi:hypothetical protein